MQGILYDLTNMFKGDLSDYNHEIFVKFNLLISLVLMIQQEESQKFFFLSSFRICIIQICEVLIVTMSLQKSDFFLVLLVEWFKQFMRVTFFVPQSTCFSTVCMIEHNKTKYQRHLIGFF